MTTTLRRLAATCLLASALGASGGCSSWSTFPPVSGGSSFAPGLFPAPQVMAIGLAYCHDRTDPSAPLVYNLPPGVSEGSWDRIGVLLGGDSRAMTPDDREVWSIEQVRIRGNSAEVDVVYLDRGVYQLATVHLEKPQLAPWRADYLQRWWIPVATPTPNHPAWAMPTQGHGEEETGETGDEAATTSDETSDDGESSDEGTTSEAAPAAASEDAPAGSDESDA